MIKNILKLSLILSAVFLGTNELQARFTPISVGSSDGPIVVELYTSQGCSSCPPADQVMNQLAENPNFIPLAFHVTYWDHLSWKDTLGRDFADKRQRSYANHKRSSRVYTPQMIINGDKEFVGSRKHEANKHLSAAKPVAQIDIAGITPDGTMITLPNIKEGDYYLWIAGVQDTHTQQIARGENRGKTVTYNNSVLTLDRGDRWNGKSETVEIKLNKADNIDHFVIFAQNKGFGDIVAAGKINI